MDRRDDRSVIDLRGIHLSRWGKEILRGIDWRVSPREQWAIVGANGSGKTTLLRIVTGYLWPSKGSVAVLGHRFGHVDLRELRKRIGWVSSALQHRMPPGCEALDAVVSGAYASIGLYARCGREQLDRARALLERMGCAGIADRPFGVLSLGEQQRVLIARSLMPDPPLLILDEPCAGLDLQAREHLLEVIDGLARAPHPDGRGRTLVFVTHHVEEITPVFTHALLLKAGQALRQGIKADVLTGECLSEAFEIAVDVEPSDGRFWARIHR